MNGANATVALIAAYDVIGELRGQVLGLQAWVRAMLGEKPVTPDAPKPSNE